MKKSKILLVAVLAFVLCFVCLATQTFSWFTLPKVQKGNSLQWGSSTSYSISTGSEDIELATYESFDDGKTFSETPVTILSNSTGIDAGQRKYYRTDIINKSASAQNVSLYISNLNIPSSDAKFNLGTDAPLKIYKSYLPQGKNETEIINTMRLYFRPKNSDNGTPDDNWNNKEYCVVYGIGEKPTKEVILTTITKNSYYYADIPAGATQIYFKVKGTAESYKRTQTFTNIASDGQSATRSKLFYLNGGYDSHAYNNAQASVTNITGANMIKDYKRVTLATLDSAFTFSMTSGKDYIGTISYEIEDKGLLEISGSTITAKKPHGSTVVTITVKGEKGDSITKRCLVTVGSIYDVPVVTNINVPKGVGTEQGMSVESVYWYIKNDSTSGSLKYTISDLYVTL